MRKQPNLLLVCVMALVGFVCHSCSSTSAQENAPFNLVKHDIVQEKIQVKPKNLTTAYCVLKVFTPVDSTGTEYKQVHKDKWDLKGWMKKEELAAIDAKEKLEKKLAQFFSDKKIVTPALAQGVEITNKQVEQFRLNLESVKTLKSDKRSIGFTYFNASKVQKSLGYSKESDQFIAYIKPV